MLLLIENLKTVSAVSFSFDNESFRAELTSKGVFMLSAKQRKFDEQKWLESEKLGADTCGTYKF